MKLGCLEGMPDEERRMMEGAFGLGPRTQESDDFILGLLAIMHGRIRIHIDDHAGVLGPLNWFADLANNAVPAEPSDESPDDN